MRGGVQTIGGLCLAIGLVAAGCADLRALVSPSPSRPPAAPPTKRESGPPPMLAPQVGKGDEERLRRESEGRIQRTEQILGGIDPQRLGTDDREAMATIRSFLAKAKDALASRDLLRASTLAEKAQILADDLSARVK